MLGSNIASYAVVWYITLKTGSSTQFALLVIASQLTMGITAVFGGIWSDRYWRKALIIGADIGTAVATFGLAAFFLLGYDSLWLIVVVLAIRGVMMGVRNPSVTASIPQLVPTRHLMRVNSLNGAMQAVISLGSPAIAAVLLIKVPLGLIFMIDAVATMVAVGLILLVRLPRLIKETPKPSGLAPWYEEVPAAGMAMKLRRLFFKLIYAIAAYFEEMIDAIKVMRLRPGLLRVTGVLAFLVFTVVPVAQLTPIFIARYFGDEPWMLAAGETAWSAGMVAGGLILMAWGGMRNRMSLIMITAVTWVVFSVLMGVSPNLVVFCVVMVVWGISLAALNATLVTTAQEQVEAKLLGRVMGLLSFILNVAGPIGIAIIGFLADFVSLRLLCIAAGGAAAVFLGLLRLIGGPGQPLMAPDAKVETPTEDPNAPDATA